MKEIINLLITVGLAVFGTICIINSLIQNEALWAVGAGVVWIAIAHRSRR